MSMFARSHVFRAKSIQRTLGTYRAARYLVNQGVLLNEALEILAPRA